MERKLYAGLLMFCALGICSCPSVRADNWKDLGDSVMGPPSITWVAPAAWPTSTTNPAGVVACSTTSSSPRLSGKAIIQQTFTHKWVLQTATGNPSHTPAMLNITAGADLTVDATSNQIEPNPVALAAVNPIQPLTAQRLFTCSGAEAQTFQLGTLVYKATSAQVSFTLTATTGGQATADADAWFTTH